MNNPLASHVLAGMRIHRQHFPPGAPAGPEDHPAQATARRLRWRPRRRGAGGDARRGPGTGGAEAAAAHGAADAEVAPGETMTGAMQLAIGLITAGLDSPDLEAWAADALIPPDADGLGTLMAGLHVLCVVLLHELHEATEEPSAAILQRLAILAERGRGRPSGGQDGVPH